MKAPLGIRLIGATQPSNSGALKEPVIVQERDDVTTIVERDGLATTESDGGGGGFLVEDDADDDDDDDLDGETNHRQDNGNKEKDHDGVQVMDFAQKVDDHPPNMDSDVERPQSARSSIKRKRPTSVTEVSSEEEISNDDEFKPVASSSTNKKPPRKSPRTRSTPVKRIPRVTAAKPVKIASVTPARRSTRAAASKARQDMAAALQEDGVVDDEEEDLE